MPTLSNILEHLAESLRNNGARFAPPVLEVMAAVTTFVLATGNATDSDIAAASYLAAQLGSDEAKRVAVDRFWPQALRSRPWSRRPYCIPGTLPRSGREMLTVPRPWHE